MKAGKDIILKAKNNITLETETANITAKAQKDAELISKTAKLKLEGATGLTATAKSGGASLTASVGEAKIDGMTAKVNATATVDVIGAIVKLNG